MADHDDDLERRFRSLDEVPVPGWRDRVRADSTDLELDAASAPGTSTRRGRTFALVGVAAVAFLLIALAVWPNDDGGDPVVAGPAAGFGDLPTTGDPLVCPPALLDTGALFDDLVPPPEVLSSPATPGGPTPYLLRWEQDGREVVLSYPGPFVSAAIAYPTEPVTLDDGQVAYLEYSERVTASVQEGETVPPDGTASVTVPPSPDQPWQGLCRGFQVSVAGDGAFVEPPAGVGGGGLATPPGPVETTLTSTSEDPVVPEATQPVRGLALKIASTVQIRPPDGAVEVPDVVGLDIVDAQDALARAGLVPAGDAPDAVPFETRLVVAQRPAAGDTVRIGEPVSITLEPRTTTTTAPPQPVEDVVVPLPDDPIVCPFGRLQVSGGVYSEPSIHSGHTVQWQGDDLTDVLLSWPNSDAPFEDNGVRQLDVHGHPALMLDGGDGQNLVYDTGLPDGPCRWIEVGVYGGSSISRREELAVDYAQDAITLGPPPSGDAPDVVGLTVETAADRLARAGFVPDWGYRRAIGDEPQAPPLDQIVVAQHLGEDGVVQLDV